MGKFKSLLPKYIVESLVPYDKSKLAKVLDTSGNYKIHARGIDDPGSTKNYSNLEDIARFLQPRDNGPDYRRNGGLQTDYMQYAFDGFNWEDLLDGDPRDYNTKYRSFLIDLPLKLKWVHEKIKEPTAAYTDCWMGYEGGDSGYDYASIIYLDRPYQGRDRLYHVMLNTNWNPVVEKSLDAAKKAAIPLILSYRKYMKDTYGGH